MEKERNQLFNHFSVRAKHPSKSKPHSYSQSNVLWIKVVRIEDIGISTTVYNAVICKTFVVKEFSQQAKTADFKSLSDTKSRIAVQFIF